MPRRLILLLTLPRQNDGSINQFVFLLGFFLHSLPEGMVTGRYRDAETRGGDSFGLTVSQKRGETGALVVKENPESEEMK